MRFIKRMSYMQDIQLFRYPSTLAWYLALIAVLLAVPFLVGPYGMSVLIFICIYAIVALGLNLLTGYTGQISLGHAALFGVGAYTSAILTGTHGLSFWVALPAAGFAAAFIGIFIGLPALRLKGLYLAIATMGLGFIVEEIIVHWTSLTGGVSGMMAMRPTLGTFTFSSDTSYYYLALSILAAMILVMKNLLRTPTGRAFIAIRDSDVAAASMGINLAAYKTIAFSISAFYAGIAGSLFAHFIYFIGPENFSFLVSISFLVMIVVGGVGSVHGAVFGAVFLTFLPEGISFIRGYLPEVIGRQIGLQEAAYGLILILFLRFEPMGLYGRWLKIKFYFEHFPFYRKDSFKRERKFYRTER